MDPKTRKGRRLAGLLIVVASALLAMGDVGLLVFYGEDATISAVVNDGAYAGPVFPFALGAVVVGLLVHFLGWSPRKNQQ